MRRPVESPSHGFAMPAPFRQGDLGTGVRIATPVTGAEEIRVSFRDQSADWSWESVIPLRKSKGDADCHDQFANWPRNDTLQGVRCVVGGRTEASAPTDSLIAGEDGTM